MRVIFLIFFLGTLISGCFEAKTLNLDEVELSLSNSFEVIPPVNYSEVKRETKFSVKNIKADWLRLDENKSIDENELNKYLKYNKSLAVSQKNKTKFSGWEASPLLNSMLTAYLLTNKEEYLEQFIWWYDYFKSVRMDSQNRPNYQGEILPQWERLDKYNIFSVSPFYNYSKSDIKKVMKERGWENLYWSDVNYSGLFIEPMLRFVQIVKSNGIVHHNKIANEIESDVKNIIKSHEADWVQINSEEGYYVFSKNNPFYFDGAEMPINEAAIFGNALVRLYLVNGDDKYLKRALQMWNRWKQYMTRDEFGYIAYSYQSGKAFEGWIESDNISVNTPVFNPPNKNTYEVFHKAALTIQFMVLLQKADIKEVEPYLKEFYYVVVAALQSSSVISKFPASLGFGYPLNSYNSHLPYVFKGWLSLASQNKEFTCDAFKNINNLPDTLYLNYLNPSSNCSPLDDISVVVKSENMHPNYLDELSNDDGNCPFIAPADGRFNMVFQHRSPKNNTLYLYDINNTDRKVRLDINPKKGFFTGFFYALKGQCVDIRWKRSQHGSPATPAENIIKLSFKEVVR